MWKCIKCGEQIEDGVDVCWNCGTLKDGEYPLSPGFPLEEKLSAGGKAKIGFWRRAFRNALRFGLLVAGLVFLLLIGVLIFGVVYSRGKLPAPGWYDRLGILSLAAFAEGAIIGFFYTRPECSSRTKNKIIGVLLVLLAMVLSLLIPFAAELAMNGRIDNVADILVFALLCPVLGAGIMCGIGQCGGIRHVSNEKPLDEKEKRKPKKQKEKLFE